MPACICATTTGRIDMKFDTGHFMWKLVEKFQAGVKSGKNKGQNTFFFFDDIKSP